VPLNLVFGVAAAWAIAKFEFPRQALADHAHRPAVLGLAGDRRPDLRAAVRRPGLVRPWLAEHDIKIIFAVPGIVLATVFVTFPFVARELIPLMQAQGPEEEEAAVVLGASGCRCSGT
jgi:sulfate transport system permease protein